MTARRIIHVDQLDDKESQYICDCGFDRFLGETCDCPQCAEFRASPGLPLTTCPDCGTKFQQE